jgi:hypothetical protein
MYDISSTINCHSSNYNPSINSSIIITHYEKVLSILNNVKQYIISTSRLQSKLIKNLDWVIKIITTHSLYAYELKEKDVIAKLAKQNEGFKNFVDFVSKYNEQVIEMNKKNIKLGAKTIEVTNDLLQKPSIKLKKNMNRVKTVTTPNKYLTKKIKGSNFDKKYSIPFLENKNKNSNFKKEINGTNNINAYDINNKIKAGEQLNNNEQNDFYVKRNGHPKMMVRSKTASENIYKKKPRICKETKIYFIDIDKFNTENIPKKNIKKISCNTKKNNEIFNIYNNIKEKKYIEKLNKSLFNFSFSKLDLLLNESSFSPKSILDKDFNIFELKKIVGHKNVLPIMGRVMLDSFGLINDKIMPTEKLEPFLISLENQYLVSTLYHNSLHGADITQTITLFFNYSNAEEISHTMALDLLSIIIAALGHDVGHPGLTNNFQVNALTDMAITYNDSSCLENFHLAKLFKILREDETNIFGKLTTQDFKKIRKKMISEILSTDMAIHGKVISNIRAKIPEYLLQDSIPKDSNKKFELITDINNEETTYEEKQALLDYFIHSADLGHNTKKFDISLKWVELLSNEFWLQGDKEKSMNLNVSFLCDRDNTDVPKGQVGFIGGFIVPTFQYLVIMFPSLNFTIENSKNNIKEWQKLVDAKRKKGWTPKKKTKKEEGKNDKKNTKIVDIIID